MIFFRYVIAICAAGISLPTLAKPSEQISDPVSIANSDNALGEQSENPEMHNLFKADQAIRLEAEKRGGWRSVKDDQAFMRRWANEDAGRLKRTKELLETDALKAGIDFYRAAFIFQHSDKSENYLKAHHLAVIAIAKGYDARWISAATLDRYLQSIGKQQIYGTQYRANETGEYVRQPVEAEAVSDAERVLLNVPALTDDK
jgi:hypothetical protein